MERKGKANEGALSPRSNSHGDEDELDFPGVEDDANGNGPVAREAHVALREAFKSLKRRLSEAEALITEQQAKLKQRDKKGLDTRVYQERDELQNCLQKSYDAFNEKYQENEQLKQKIQELKEALKLSKEANTQGEGSAGPSSASEVETTSENKKYTTLIEELKIMGLEVIEENEQLFIILTDRDNLKKWIEESSDGNITVVFKGSALEDKDTKTEGVSTLHEGHEQTEGKRKRLEAEIILLKRKIQDQAEEMNRFYKVFKQAMEENLRTKEKKQAEGRNIEQGLPTPTQNQAAASGVTSQRTTSHTSTALREKAETMLASAQDKVAEMKQVKEHLDKQNKSLRTLIDLTEKTTTDFSQLVGARNPREVPDSPGGRIPSQGMEMGASFSQGQRSREGNFERVFSDDAPLSMPVQETEKHRLKSSGADEEISNEAMYNLRLTGGEGALAPSSAVFSKRVEGRAVPMTTPISENTWTGESDIEVIEEEEDFVGASASRGKFCPVCERFFPASYGQNEFELHVQQHFEDDA